VSQSDKSALARLMPAWWPALAYMGLIWFLSSRPVDFSLEDVPFKDKGVHFVEYAALAVLSARAITRSWPGLGVLRAVAWAGILTACWGYLDELHQAFVPTRDSSALDFLADAIGAVMGVAGFLALQWLRKGRAGATRG